LLSDILKEVTGRPKPNDKCKKHPKGPKHKQSPGVSYLFTLS